MPQTSHFYVTIIPLVPLKGSAQARSLPTEGLYKRLDAALKRCVPVTMYNTGLLLCSDIDLMYTITLALEFRLFIVLPPYLNILHLNYLIAAITPLLTRI
jgi:hypothetical protein